MSTAFIFPGQGSQSVGMQDDLADGYEVVRETYEQASSVLGYDLWELVSEGDEQQLKQTAVTQPTLLTAGVAAWNVWRELGGCKPDLMAGHSLGEYTALVCAGVIDFSDAVDVVRCRGEYMQSAVPQGQGAMAAVMNLDPQLVAHLCEKVADDGVVQVANYNSSVQTVVAGEAAAVEQLNRLASEAGAKRVVMLPVSAPFHCQLMAPAADQMRGLLQGVTFSKPQIPVINNIDVEIVDDPELIKQALVRQVTGSVRWVEVVEKMSAAGVTKAFECGPGKVLTGLGKRITREIAFLPLVDRESIQEAAAELN